MTDAPFRILSRAELERAALFMRNHPDTRILNARVAPHWFVDSSRFWYKRELRNGHDFCVVDAGSGSKTLAFDHQAVAAALSRATGSSIRPTNIPVVAIEDGYVEASVDGARHRCDTSNLTCSRLPLRDPAELLSPDGTWALFRRSENLWLRNSSDGSETQLTTDGEAQYGYGMASDRYDQNKLLRERTRVDLPPIQTWWAPDSRRVVTARLDQRHLEPYYYLGNAPFDGTFRPRLSEIRLPLLGEKPGQLDWWVIDIPSGEKRQIHFPVERMIAANNGIDDLKIDWADGGETLLAISGMTDLTGAEVFAVNLASGAVRTVLVDQSSPGNPLVAGGYGRPVSRFVRGGTELVWWSERDGWGHLYRYRVSDGRLLAQLTTGPWIVRDIIGVNERAGEIWFTTMGRDRENPYHRDLYCMNLDDGSAQRLMSPEPGDHMIVDPTGSDLVFDGAKPTAVLAPDFQSYVYDVSSITEPTRTILRRANDTALVAEVQHADASGLIASGYRPPQEIAVTADDGASVLHGLVYRPMNHDPGKTYAVVDVEYGNPAVAITPRTYHHAATFSGTAATPSALAELGFIVVVLDARGTPYRGRAFSHAGHDYLTTMGLKDHVTFIEKLSAIDPSIDIARVGIAGQSFGGYTVLRALIEFPEVFKAGVAGAPQTGYHNMAAEAVLTASQGPPRYSDGTSIRPSPTEIPANFVSLDAGSQLDRLKSPLLIVAGELDENVYPGTIIQFFRRAFEENLPVELIWVPNGGHDVLFTPYALIRSIEFLTRHLQRRLLPGEIPALPDPVRS